MQNEFEKQVEQKMEELNLVPSDPVWQKVEMQIRKKNDRRRIILWIPLFVLIATGLWTGIDQYSNTFNSRKTIDKIKKENYPVVPQSTQKTLEEDNQVLVHKSGNETPHLTGIISKRKNLNLLFVPLKTSSQEKNRKEISTADRKKTSAKIGQTFVVENTIQNNHPDQSPNNITARDTSLKTTQNGDTIIAANDLKTSSQTVSKDSTVIKKPAVNKHAFKWKANIVAAAGSSGLGRINMYNGQKAMSTYSTPSMGANGGNTGSQFGYGPSEVEKGSFFAFGVLSKKRIGKRTFFSSGLQYNYYSNTIQVGTSVNQNTVIMAYAVTQYYSNQTNATQPYRNKYHFISVPLSLDWQLLKKHPLNFTTGLSVQYLIETNGLRFDYATQSYFHNIKAFNRTQLFSELDLIYSVTVKQKPLTFGPQLQYGITKIEKDNADHHLFSYSLKAQWQLSKN